MGSWHQTKFGLSGKRLLLLLAFLPCLASAQRFPVVRVGLVGLGASSQYTLSSDQPFGVFDAKNNALVAQWAAGTQVSVSIQNGKVKIGSQTLSAAYFSSEGAWIRVSGSKAIRRYRGWIAFQPQNSTFLAVNELPLEAYLMGVVPCEMGASSPLEALKAQAIAARTFTINRLGSFNSQGFDLDDTVRSHVYMGMEREDPRSSEAVRLTANQLLVYKGKPISAVYSSNSGGVTASAREAWGDTAKPYLSSFPDLDNAGMPFSSSGKWATWDFVLTSKECSAVVNKARPNAGEVREIRVLSTSESGRVDSIALITSKGSLTLRGSEFRTMFGNERVRSLWFGVIPIIGGWRLEGRGWGHGVGLCQEGAKGRALVGQDYKTILGAYYRGAELLTVRNSPIELSTRGSFVERRKFSRGTR